MANITLHLDDATTRITVKAMLEAEGHRIVVEDGTADLALAGSPEAGIALARDLPVLVLATAGQIPEVVRAMARGVYGYVFLPLQPGELALMVRRGLEAHGQAGQEGADELELRPLAEVEQRHIEQTLVRCKNNQARTARVLGIGRNTLWRKLKQYAAQASSETGDERQEF